MYICIMKNQIFIEKAINKHGDFYDYSRVEYKTAKVKVEIGCPKHGYFFQTPDAHTSQGSGCHKCGQDAIQQKKTYTQEEYIKLATEKHNGIYDYSETVYNGVQNKIDIICKVHGKFTQTGANHLASNGCPKCAHDYRVSCVQKDQNHFLTKSKEAHREFYDYSKAVYVSAREKVTIICPTHGDFEQLPSSHYQGHGCEKCGREQTIESLRDSQEDFIKKAIDTHGDTFNYDNVQYVDAITKVKINCKKHGIFEQQPYNHLQGKGCSKCSQRVSAPETEIFGFVKEQGFIDIEGSKRGLAKGYELDIYIPSKNIAIEYNGLYWHSEERLGKNYHQDKTNKAREAGIKLIHIFEDEWLYKRDIVESRLLNILGKTPNKIYARECEIREVNESVAEFLDKNHLQGKVGSKIKLGLYYKNELVSLMTFGDLRKNLGSKKEQDVYEMIRFCNRLNTNVIGAASRLLKHFIKNYNPKEIISYADRRWSEGELYEKLQFELVAETVPNYFYTKGNKREARFKYRKDILVSEGFDPSKSEKQIMEERGYKRIYDCGTLKYTLKTKNKNQNE